MDLRIFPEAGGHNPKIGGCQRLNGECIKMDKKSGGTFSLGFKSLQLHLSNLLSDSGGDLVVDLLDSLTRLSQAEQAIVLKGFIRIIERIDAGKDRLSDDRDALLHNFEESLYQEILVCMRDAANTTPKLEVVQGGNLAESISKTPIDLCSARKNRKPGQKRIFN
ncbi:MAG: hypothetical protein DCC75_01835 [Proteobacteria bacterium]|nr:MAG: hypothetical protein DCC75_01835 [Pseudomonadota bacterium]